MLCENSGGGSSNPSSTSGSSSTFGGGTVSGGGTGSSGTYSYSPHYINNPAFEDLKYINELNKTYTWNNLSKELKDFFNTRANNKYFNETIQYQIDNKWSSESKEIADWARNYKFENPSVTWEQFKNWFIGKSEGKDGDYDAAFWENSNLTFPSQSLPSFNDFKNACPSKNTDSGALCNDMGGEILEMYNAVIAKGKKLNTCAIRISKAFQGSGILIPALPDNPNGTKNTVKDKNGNNIIINAKVLNQWMRKTFGTNPSNYIHIKASQGGYNGKNFPKLLKNKQGIYSMIARPEIQKDWGTGHADLLENGECRQNCHFYDENNLFVPVDYIDIWILD